MGKATVSRALNKLSAKGLKSAPHGRHSDGGGLYLSVSRTGSRSWVFMWKKAGIRREMGLGGYPAVSLAKAREFATAARTAAAEGRDPIAERRREAEPTFGECADQFINEMESQWRNPKHRAQWRMTLTQYCNAIRPNPVSSITTDDVLRVLKPIWTEKPETASRLRGRIERVLDFATVRGWRNGDNPARWRGHLKAILPERPKLSRGHMAAMPYADLPEFLRQVRAREAMAARALEFLVLTAARTGEVLGARWDEIDFSTELWTVPADRMKAGRPHRVPLTKDALALLMPLHEARISEYIFPGQRGGKPLSSAALSNLMTRLGADDYTVHGFRSAFRDWVGDKTTHSRDVAEAALAHVLTDKTEAAYRRADALEKRRNLMNSWSRFCASTHFGRVAEQYEQIQIKKT